MMTSVPGKDKGIVNNKSPLETIRKMKAVFKSLNNKPDQLELDHGLERRLK